VQHRMRPEISALIRQLTYPDLVDAAKTKNRADLRGVQDVIVFINHDEPEDITPQLTDPRDNSSISSKQNSHEVGMVLMIVRYLAQQGYGTEKIVILTPYLGQLHKLQEVLREDNDPILNDLDSYDLVRAGMLLVASAKIKKKSIRLATIGMYVPLCPSLFRNAVDRSSHFCRQLPGRRERYCHRHPHEKQCEP